MTRGLKALIVLVALGCALFLFTDTAHRTRAFLRFEHLWEEKWPFAWGKDLPARYEPALTYCRVLGNGRMEVEPGVSLWLDSRDMLTRQLLADGIYEPESWQFIAEHLPKGGVFVDIGAHIGYYSLKAAAQVGPAGRVVSIEPNPRTAQLLRDNVKYSKASAVSVQEVACSNQDAMLDFFAASRLNTGASSLSQATASSWGSEGVASYKVHARPLDDVVDDVKLTRLDAIKIDVEGAEVMVLQGARRTIARFRPFLLTEVIDRQLEAMKTSRAELLKLLDEIGYEPVRTIDINIGWAPRAQTRSR